MTIEDILNIFENFYAFEQNQKLLLKIDNVFYPIKIKKENRAVVAIYNEKLDKKYKKILKQNKYLKERIKKMKCCANCKKYRMLESQMTLKCLKNQRTNFCCTEWEMKE